MHVQQVPVNVLQRWTASAKDAVNVIFGEFHLALIRSFVNLVRSGSKQMKLDGQESGLIADQKRPIGHI